MGIMAAQCAFPVLPKAHRQDRDPEDVPHIEGPDGDGAARRAARKAVVIAKRNLLWPEMVGAVNDKHGDSAEAVQRYISLLPQGTVRDRPHSADVPVRSAGRSEEHTSELQSRQY